MKDRVPSGWCTPHSLIACRRAANILVASILLLSAALAAQDPLVTLPDKSGHQSQPWSLRDEAQLTSFGDEPSKAIQVSPDGKFVAVWSEGGSLAADAVIDRIRVYSMRDVDRFLESPAASSINPVRVVEASQAIGPAIDRWVWLRNAAGIAYLSGDFQQCQTLFLAAIGQDKSDRLTPPGRCVRAFAVTDKNNYVYTAAQDDAESTAAKRAVFGTGAKLIELLFNDKRATRFDLRLWSVKNGQGKAVGGNNRIIGQGLLAVDVLSELEVSPDGRYVVTAVATHAPSDWPEKFRSVSPSSPQRLIAGSPAVKLVIADLQQDKISDLTGGPVADSGGWWTVFGSDLTFQPPEWSADGRYVLVPATYIGAPEAYSPWPCVAVVEVSSLRPTCVMQFGDQASAAGGPDQDLLASAHFADGRHDAVNVGFGVHGVATRLDLYRQDGRRRWRLYRSRRVPASAAAPAPDSKVTIEQDINSAPRVFAWNGRVRKLIWDPNPHLAEVNLPDAREYTWRDEAGRTHTGMLFVPAGHNGKRLPLVIQTHGMVKDRFVPSGLVPGPFAARALQSAGIIVLQFDERCVVSTSTEVDCALKAYRGAVAQLERDGLIDTGKIGIAGWSRTGLYALHAALEKAIPLAAVSISDSNLGTVSQYINTEGFEQAQDDSEIINGASIYSANKADLLKTSPTFNLNKIDAPVLGMAFGQWGMLNMWELYAGLHHLGKPTEILKLRSFQHTPSNPTERFAAQSALVDWFRFWLQGWEDLDPAKREQYARWRKMRDQAAAHKTSASSVSGR